MEGNLNVKSDKPVKENEVPPRAETEDRPVIHARCERYACRACRTKTGWQHQIWCELGGVAAPDCGDCRYWEPAAGVCKHPAQKRKGAGET